MGVAQRGDQGTNQLPAAADPPGSETNQKRLDHFPEFLTSNTNINKFMRLFSGFGFSKNNRPIEHAPPPEVISRNARRGTTRKRIAAATFGTDSF